MSRGEFRAWHWKGEKILPCSGNIPLADRGFRYGEHVFESIATREGKFLLADEHLALLGEAARRQELKFSRGLAAGLRRFFSKMKLEDGMLRIYLTAGPGAPGEPVKKSPCYLTWEAVRFPTQVELIKGFSLRSLKKPAEGATWGEKSGNYAAHLHALREARGLGADEAVVFDTQGRILSCSMGNLLIWMKSPHPSGSPVLCTPPASIGARRGALLSWVTRHTRVEEREFRKKDLGCALALAVTNSRLGVMPVAQCDGKEPPNFSLSINLAREYLRYASTTPGER
ncbi:MAG: aminotransferase class IV [Verrucomicrobiota bacterium]